MKTLYIYLICFISAGFSACSLLELEPTTSWSTENTPKEESHLYGILYGGYNTLQSDLSINFLIYGEMRGDAFYNNAFNVNTDKVVNNSLDNNISQASWYNYYRAIKQANVVIKFTPQVLEAGGISTEKANDVMGQAYCLRAFAYFWIIRIWGDAPLVTEPYMDSNDNFDRPRTSVAEIIKQIHSDLENAAKMIDKNSASRTTFAQTAAYAIDAHVYAWEHKYEKTISMADKVLANTGYTLANLYDEKYTGVTDNPKDKNFKAFVQASEYAQIFNAGRSKESIFELASSVADGDDQKNLTSYLSGTYPILRPRTRFGEAIDTEGSSWRSAAIHEAVSGKYKVTKFTIGFDYTADSRNIVMLRLADIILLKAEAIANQEDTDENRKAIMKLVNQIRRRAAGSGYEIPEEQFLNREEYDQEGIREIVLNERRYELAYEGHRWFDLIRTGKVFEAVKNRGNDIGEDESPAIELHPKALVWPIHLNELRRSKLIEQNEYYK